MGKIFWKRLQTGGCCYVSVADFKICGKLLAVGVTDDSIAIYKQPYDAEWRFFENELVSWPLADEEDVLRFLNESRKYFSKQQQNLILEEHRNYCK